MNPTAYILGDLLKLARMWRSVGWNKETIREWLAFAQCIWREEYELGLEPYKDWGQEGPE